MYICLECNRKFKSKEQMQKHFLVCWKENHPNSISKEAPHSENVIVRKVDNDIADFFNSFA